MSGQEPVARPTRLRITSTTPTPWSGRYRLSKKRTPTSTPSKTFSPWTKTKTTTTPQSCSATKSLNPCTESTNSSATTDSPPSSGRTGSTGPRNKPTAFSVSPWITSSGMANWPAPNSCWNTAPAPGPKYARRNIPACSRRRQTWTPKTRYNPAATRRRPQNQPQDPKA